MIDMPRRRAVTLWQKARKKQKKLDHEQPQKEDSTRRSGRKNEGNKEIKGKRTSEESTYALWRSKRKPRIPIRPVAIACNELHHISTC